MDAYRIEGGTHTDARGTLRFCNAFDLSRIKRFYTIANSADHPQRGWILHRRETKWFFPLRGETLLSIEPEDSHLPHQEVVLSATHPYVLCVPPGNWFLIEQDGTAEVQVFSDCALGEYKVIDTAHAICHNFGLRARGIQG